MEFKEVGFHFLVEEVIFQDSKAVMGYFPIKVVGNPVIHSNQAGVVILGVVQGVENH